MTKLDEIINSKYGILYDLRWQNQLDLNDVVETISLLDSLDEGIEKNIATTALLWRFVHFITLALNSQSLATELKLVNFPHDTNPWEILYGFTRICESRIAGMNYSAEQFILDLKYD